VQKNCNTTIEIVKDVLMFRLTTALGIERKKERKKERKTAKLKINNFPNVLFYIS
jgi:hypothetical protein